MNEALVITGAIFAVLTALIFNRKDVTDLKTEMKERNAVLSAEIKDGMAGVRGEMGSLKSDMKDLRIEMRDGFSQVNTRIENVQADINGRIDRVQGDINTFAIVNALHDQRLSQIESAAKS